MAPLPVPISKIFTSPPTASAAMTMLSTKSSVSGRGTRVSGVTLNILRINAFSPKIYAKGSCLARRTTYCLNCASSFSVRGLSKSTYRLMRSHFKTAQSSTSASRRGFSTPLSAKYCFVQFKIFIIVQTGLVSIISPDAIVHFVLR